MAQGANSLPGTGIAGKSPVAEALSQAICALGSTHASLVQTTAQPGHNSYPKGKVSSRQPERRFFSLYESPS
jgi:hypothetical protein